VSSVPAAVPSPANDGRTGESRGAAWHAWAAGFAYFACAAAFLGDVTHDTTWAYGVLYVPLVCTAIFYRSPESVWWLAGLAMTMVVLGWYLPVMHFDAASLGSRALAATAILTAAGLVRLARSMRDRLEQESLRAQAADRLKANIFANLSHELRTPLNAIIGFAELLLTDCRPDQRNALEHLQSAGRRLLLTVENLLDLSRAPDQVLRAEPIDLAAILGRAIDAARTASFARQITLLNSIAADTPPAIGDAWATRRIADNLIGNAVKFTPPGGSVRVATEAAEGRVCAVVTDTGGGMPPEVLDQLGEPFFQARAGLDRPHEGLGTGLALCRKLAEAMGARLEFASQPGQGTTVRLCLHAA
jgi:signal transduction histidine kinase